MRNQLYFLHKNSYRANSRKSPLSKFLELNKNLFTLLPFNSQLLSFMQDDFTKVIESAPSIIGKGKLKNHKNWLW